MVLMSIKDDPNATCVANGHVYSTWTAHSKEAMTVGANFTIGPEEVWRKPLATNDHLRQNCAKMGCLTSVDELKKSYNFVEVSMHSEVLSKLDANATSEWSVVKTSDLPQFSDAKHTKICHFVGAEGDPLYMCHDEPDGITATGLTICATNGLGCMETVSMCHWMQNGWMPGCGMVGTDTGYLGCHVTTPGDIMFTGLREQIMV